MGGSTSPSGLTSVVEQTILAILKNSTLPIQIPCYHVFNPQGLS